MVPKGSLIDLSSSNRIPDFFRQQKVLSSAGSQLDTEMTFPPILWYSSTAYRATLPNPWMLAVVFSGFRLSSLSASRTIRTTMYPVACVRPRDPPTLTGLPVMNPG